MFAQQTCLFKRTLTIYKLNNTFFANLSVRSSCFFDEFRDEIQDETRFETRFEARRDLRRDSRRGETRDEIRGEARLDTRFEARWDSKQYEMTDKEEGKRSEERG